MLEINARETQAISISTGMNQTAATQRVHYDNFTIEQGVFNVTRANKSYLDNEKSQPAPDQALIEWLTNRQKELQEIVAAETRKRKGEEYLEKAATSNKFQTACHKVPSDFRLLHLEKVYLWSHLEFAAFVLYYPSYPKITSTYRTLFARFFFGEGMADYRKQALDIQALRGVSNVDQLLKLLLKSPSRNWNTHRLEKDNLHLILRFHNKLNTKRRKRTRNPSERPMMVANREF
jgi:hypothetical protein